MQRCPHCDHEEPEMSRFCTHCGTSLLGREHKASLADPSERRLREELNLNVLYAMVGVLILALLTPPWETPPGQPPEFLGFHFFLSPPPAGTDVGVVSRLLLTIELVTLAVTGLYFSWLFRKRG